MPRLLTILLLLTALGAAAQKNRPASSGRVNPAFAQEWQRADSLAKKGLPKSALAIVNRIYTQAKASRNNPQLVKAAMHRLMYQPYTTEDTYAEMIEVLRSDVADTPAPARNILQSILAETYWQYYQQNRWKFSDRHTDDGPSSDPRTWSLRRLVAETVTAYEASLSQTDLLKKTPVSTFEVIVKKGDADARALRPTLYDFLAHRALAFYTNTEPEIIRPAIRFELDQPVYLSDADAFLNTRLVSSDSLSMKFRALWLYQNLLAFHQPQTNSLARADVDAQRLAFVYEHSVIPNKNDLYQQILERAIKANQNQPAELVYGLSLARLWANQGDRIKTGGWRRKAADLATDLLKRFPKSGVETGNLRQLLSQLNTRSVAMTVEEGNTPDQPIRAMVTYRNVPTLHYRIVRVSVHDYAQFSRRRYNDGREIAALYLKRPIIKQGNIILPDDADLQQHGTEVALPILPLGNYVVLTSPQARMTDTTEGLALIRLTVTNLGYLIGNRPVAAEKKAGTKTGPDELYINQDPKLYVVNRQTGQPVANVRVDLIESYYSGNTEKQRNAGSFRTDAAGGLVVSDAAVSNNHGYRFRILAQRDSIETEQVYWPGYHPYPNPNEKEVIQTLLFTDRAIYRPGQPIFFKGVLYKGRQNDFQAVANAKTEATLTDINGEKVASLTLTSNAFGTVDGQFTAPAGRLTGAMVISIESSQVSVRVEEYKRPTFEVKADPVKGSYKLGQPVSVSATAKTFAGAVVDRASVRYRVVRRLRPRWIWWDLADYMPTSRKASYGGPETEIVTGTLTTDSSGAVSLTFVAQPDLTIDRSTDPTFNFSITFDVTDRTGETRSAEQTLSIGYSALTATLDLPTDLDRRDQTIALRVTNAGGQRVPVSGQLTISPLQQPDRPLRKRLWGKPDRFALSREAFNKLFPNDVYADEDQLPNWPKGQPVETITVGTSDTLKLAASRYPAGTYAADLRVTDAAGESVTLTQYFTVTADEQPVSKARPDAWVKALTSEIKPGKSAVFLVSTGAGGHALMRIVQNGRVHEERWITLENKPVRVEIPVTKAQIGGFVVSFTRVEVGRVYSVSKPVSVPMPDKTLRFETLTFRDHLKPGQPEQWTLRISGPGKEKLLAEAVATLYDASLDAFVPLNWPGSPYQTPYQPLPNWSATGFNVAHSAQFWFANHENVLSVMRIYDALAWSGSGYANGRVFQFNDAALQEVVTVGYGRNMGGGARVMAAAAPKAVRGAVAMRKEDGSGSAASDQVIELEEAVAAELLNPNKPVAANPRRNFNETAFFFPKLQTDEQGRIRLNFTMPEALTRWRLLAFAHTADLKTGLVDRSVVTQKELMISANVPRFLREGDTLRLTARINNLTNKPLNGTAQVEVIDPATGQLLTTKLFSQPTIQSFTAAGNQSTALGWVLLVPQGATTPGLENVTFRVSAGSGDFTDAEERTVPVLPNRMLVLDSQPFFVNGPGKKEVRLPALANQSPELPLSAERLTVELTSNPVWTALQSLPYLAEFPYECAEQLFSRFYANALASRIINARPDIRAVAETWARQAPMNPLEANPELKSVTLDQTPWRREARSQNAQLAKLGQFLTDENLMAGQQQALEKLLQLQTSEGGFAWFAGMSIDRTISLHILIGFGHLARLGVTMPERQRQIVESLQSRALQYADEAARLWVEQHKREKTPAYVGYWPVQYLYARSFYPNQPIQNKAVRDYLQTIITKNWLQQGIHEQILSALALHRLGNRETPAAILKSLKERAAQSDELGMYWPDNKAGYHWQQAPIETQALLIEAFSEIDNDQAAVNAMKQWLLAQKRTQAWPSTKATTEAIYALLLNGDDWLTPKGFTELRVGGKLIETAANDPTGYQKVTYQPADIKPELGVITVSKAGSGPAWGGIYYQHYEPLDQVTPSSATKAAMGNLTVTKQLFVQQDSPAGPVSSPVTGKMKLKPGDQLRVRVEVRNDRDMQYIHLKDSRASGFEPVDALSGYRYQNGLGYYQAPRDASTDFYLSALPAGTHVFEYNLRVVHEGNFSTGVATIQCFYAPEFSARSPGGRVQVK